MEDKGFINKRKADSVNKKSWENPRITVLNKNKTTGGEFPEEPEDNFGNAS